MGSAGWGVSQLSYDSSIFVTDRAGQLFKSLNSTEKLFLNLIIHFFSYKSEILTTRKDDAEIRRC